MAKKPAKATPAAEVLPPEEPKDLVAARAELTPITDWLGRLAPFFETARQLEDAAKARLERVKQLPIPTTVEADREMREEVKDARAARKAVGDHWDITRMFSGFHKKLTGARSRAEQPLEEAERWATRLHEEYERTERRRAAEEDARRRREAEDRARAEQEADLARMEQEALRHESTLDGLSDRESVFVDSYVATGDAINAATVAGYADPKKQAQRLLGVPKILKGLEAKRAAIATRQQAQLTRDLGPRVDYTPVAPQLNTGDAKTWRAEIVDLEAFRNAAFDGTHAIPRELFIVDEARLQGYARQLEALIEQWPGIVARQKTTVR